MYNSLLNVMLQIDVKILAFADYVALVATKKNPLFIRGEAIGIIRYHNHLDGRERRLQLAIDTTSEMKI